MRVRALIVLSRYNKAVKRANGTGSLYWSESYKRFVAQVVRADEEGNRHRVKLYGPRRDRSAPARRALAFRLDRITAGSPFELTSTGRRAKRALPGVRSYVYGIVCGDRVKIGYAVNPQRRLSTVAVDNPCPVSLRWRFPGGVELEMQIHERLRAHRERGEWFLLNEDVESVLDQLQAAALALVISGL